MVLLKLPLPFPRAKTNSNAINFVNLRLSTELCVTMKIKPAKTAGRSVIESTIVRNSVTSLQASYVVPAGMLATLLEIVPTDSVVLTGEMVLQLKVALLVVQLLVELVPVMLLIANTSNLCKNCPAAVLHLTDQLLNGSKLDLAAMAKALRMVLM